jgi:hypothetical protein
MTTSDLSRANLRSISERGLGFFLQAVAEIVPDIDLSDAGDCWISALESKDSVTGMSAERFVRQATMNAFASNARHFIIESSGNFFWIAQGVPPRCDGSYKIQIAGDNHRLTIGRALRDFTRRPPE